MKKRFALCVVSAALVGYVIGRITGSTASPVVGGHLSDLSFIEQAFAQDNKPEAMPFGSGAGTRCTPHHTLERRRYPEGACGYGREGCQTDRSVW